MQRRRVIMEWGVSSYFGWGIYGLNLALAWAQDSRIDLITSRPIDPQAVCVDPLRLRYLTPFLESSASYRSGGGSGGPNDVHLCPLGGGSLPGSEQQASRIGVIFFEEALPSETADYVRGFPIVVAGSTWNARLLRAYGVSSATTIIQGMDPALFHPAQKTGFFGDRFLVFSGGKAEARKAQDLVLAAFRRFVKQRPNALLVTAWHSPWSRIARTLDRSGLAAPAQFTSTGKLDVVAWAAASGVDPSNVIDVGFVPNMQMPTLLREMDVALFPNRAEGGTNLVAMECMACGVPAILAANTGQLDLISEDNCYRLERQTPTPSAFQGVGDVEGWSDSDVDEIVEALERAYIDRKDAQRRGLAGAQFLSRFCWARTAGQMKSLALAV